MQHQPMVFFKKPQKQASSHTPISPMLGTALAGPPFQPRLAQCAGGAPRMGSSLPLHCNPNQPSVTLYNTGHQRYRLHYGARSTCNTSQHRTPALQVSLWCMEHMQHYTTRDTSATGFTMVHGAHATLQNTGHQNNTENVGREWSSVT